MLRGRLFPRLAVALAAAGLLSCQAPGPRVVRRPGSDLAVGTIGRGAEVDRITYGYSARTGDAWINLFLIDRSFEFMDGQMRSGPRRTQVPGLLYRPDSKEIVLARPGQEPVVCARVVAKRFLVFAHTDVDETGNCGVTNLKDEPGTRATRVVYFGRLH
jgi:hypothetical protein